MTNVSYWEKTGLGQTFAQMVREKVTAQDLSTDEETLLQTWFDESMRLRLQDATDLKVDLEGYVRLYQQEQTGYWRFEVQDVSLARKHVELMTEALDLEIHAMVSPHLQSPSLSSSTFEKRPDEVKQ